MTLRRRALRLSLLLLGSHPAPAAASVRDIDGASSAGTHIHVERELDLSSAGYRSTIDIQSDVPITIQRYSDDQFFMGQQPVPDNMAKVLVISDCDTSASQVIPDIVVSSGSISVTLHVDKDAANAMPFLEPSSYSAHWTVGSDCRNPQTGEPFVDNLLAATALPVAQTVTGSCNSGEPCAEKGSTCGRGTETCCGVTHDSVQCSCRSMNGSLRYRCIATDACMIPSCCRSGSAEGMPPPAPGTCAPGSLCDLGVEDDFCCTNMEGLGTYCSKTGGAAGAVSEEASTSAATTDAGTSGSTTVSTTAMAENFAIDGNFPTAEPTKPSNSKISTPSPNHWSEEEGDPDRASSSNSASDHSRSLYFGAAITFAAISVVSLIFPGSGGNNNLWGIGKIAVAAAAVASLHSRKSPASGGADARGSDDEGPKSFPVRSERALETCAYNVEILIDGCNHPLEISAPSGRVIDVVIEDLVSNDLLDCVTEYEATLNFPMTSETIVLNLEDGGTVNTLGSTDFSACARAVIGRPFIDAMGGSLQAMAWIPDDKVESAVLPLSWTGESSIETQTSPMNNATGHAGVFLGEDWIRRALGEHASIASFSAFAIALMSNGAPAVLVDDALKAGIDEVRHARISFDIASKLSGREVGPGPLPESKLEFSHDLKALALAVAIEGCLDETLSAFAAAVEVKHITEVLDSEMQGTPYSDVGRDLLALIRNELVTIAMDESNHSALAWRTLNWVCSVDSKVCDYVHNHAFEESNLEMRFSQHADSAFSEMSSLLHLMREEWDKIFKAHQLANSDLEDETICKDEDTVLIGKYGSSHPLVTLVTENILRQVKRS